MQSVNFEEVLEQMVEHDSRYSLEAYRFLRESLEFTQRNAGKPRRGEIQHVTGKELLDGIRRYALEQYGPMALMVLGEWGIRSCEDFGEIVFNMIEFNLLAKTETDSREDFKNGYNFQEAFCKPFLPSTKRSNSGAQSVQV